MKRNTLLTVAAVLTLLFTLTYETQFANPVYAQSTPDEAVTDGEVAFNGWQVRNGGGYFSENDGTVRIWGDAHEQGITFYKMIAPINDFEFSLQARANQIDGFGIFVGTESFLKSETKEGVQFEFHNKYGVNTFLLARFVHTIVWETGKPGDIWDWHGFAYGEENVWYTMKLKVQANPLKVSGEVCNENGVLIGNYSVSDMINLSFDDIKILGFTNGWGGDYSVRNISEITDIACEPNPSGKTPSQISINPDVSSTTLGTPLSIKGKLVDAYGEALTEQVVVLSYSFQGVDGWLPISSTYTNMAGEYFVQWANTATGYFALKAEWRGNMEYTSCSNSTTVNILPYEDNKVFFVQSNSTITALSFNSSSSELTFSVTGPSGTHGYTQVILDKSLISRPQNFQVGLDGEQLEYIMTDLRDSWLITLHYSHSTHEISMQLQPKPAAISLNQDDLLWVNLTIATICLALIAVAAVKRRTHLPK